MWNLLFGMKELIFTDVTFERCSLEIAATNFKNIVKKNL